MYSWHGSICSNSSTISSGSSFALQILAGVKPKTGSTVCVGGFRHGSWYVCIGRLIFLGFGLECVSGVSTTSLSSVDIFLKSGEILDDWRKVKSCLINLRHLSSPFMWSVNARSLQTTGRSEINSIEI